MLELTRADARLELIDVYGGLLTEAPGYFNHYHQATIPWQLIVGIVDGDPVALCQHRDGDGWTLVSAIKLRLDRGRIAEIRDYTHCEWLLPTAASVRFHPEVGTTS